jgi:hypothetical protein
MLRKADHQGPRQQGRQQNTAYACEQGTRHDGPKRERHGSDYAPRPETPRFVHFWDWQHFCVAIKQISQKIGIYVFTFDIKIN